MHSNMMLCKLVIGFTDIAIRFCQVLDTLVEVGQISTEAAAAAKARVSELHHALVSAMSEEQALTVQAAQLAKDREVSKYEMQLKLHRKGCLPLLTKAERSQHTPAAKKLVACTGHADGYLSHENQRSCALGCFAVLSAAAGE
jgi:hypothetical protein